MRRFSPFVFGLVAAIALAGASVAAQGAGPKAAPGPTIVLETAKGSIEIETLPGDAPKSVAHVVELVKKGFYRGLRVHWAQPGVVQTGDPSSRDMSKMDSWGTQYGTPVGVAETSKRAFDRGIVGLAYRKDRTAIAAGSQFFILTHPNPALNGKYAVIGRVTKGMNVVDKLEVGDMIKMASVK